MIKSCRCNLNWLKRKCIPLKATPLTHDVLDWMIANKWKFANVFSIVDGLFLSLCVCCFFVCYKTFTNREKWMFLHACSVFTVRQYEKYAMMHLYQTINFAFVSLDNAKGLICSCNITLTKLTIMWANESLFGVLARTIRTIDVFSPDFKLPKKENSLHCSYRQRVCVCVFRSKWNAQNGFDAFASSFIHDIVYAWACIR